MNGTDFLSYIENQGGAVLKALKQETSEFNTSFPTATSEDNTYAGKVLSISDPEFGESWRKVESLERTWYDVQLVLREKQRGRELDDQKRIEELRDALDSSVSKCPLLRKMIVEDFKEDS